MKAVYERLAKIELPENVIIKNIKKRKLNQQLHDNKFCEKIMEDSDLINGCFAIQCNLGWYKGGSCIIYDNWINEAFGTALEIRDRKQERMFGAVGYNFENVVRSISSDSRRKEMTEKIGKKWPYNPGRNYPCFDAKTLIGKWVRNNIIEILQDNNDIIVRAIQCAYGKEKEYTLVEQVEGVSVLDAFNKLEKEIAKHLNPDTVRDVCGHEILI